MLSLESDILRIASVPISDPPTTHIFLFQEIEHLRKERSGRISAVKGSIPVKVEFSLDYLTSGAVRVTVLDSSLLRPDTDFFHPAVDPVCGIISLGQDVLPATLLPRLICRLYEVLTSYQRFSLTGGSAANEPACRYLRDHPKMVSTFRVPPLIRIRFRTSGAEQRLNGSESAPSSF